MSEVEGLPSWRDTDTRRAMVEFVEEGTTPGARGYGPPAERIAVFDNDGTLWTEKPLPIQLDFSMRGFAAAAQHDPALREQQPFKAAHERDFGWLGPAMVKRYQGDDAALQLLFAGLSKISVGVDVEAYTTRVNAFFEQAEHTTLGRPYLACAYVPMVELLRYLEANGFLTFIVSAGERDFMRPVG